MNAVFGLFSLFTILVPIVLGVIVIIFVVRIVRRMEQRADERLKIDKENALFQQDQMKAIHDLGLRLSNIEKMLKEVD